MARKYGTLDEYLNNYKNMSFSDADIALGRDNLDVFGKIVDGKEMWLNATDDTGRTSANQYTENIRKAYGNYAGGVDGTKGQYKAPKPTFDTSNKFDKDDYYNDLTSAYDKKAPTYNSNYSDQIDELLNSIVNKKDFDYDMNADPLYQQYKDQYVREGDRAMRDTAGNAAALTGGFGSTYGVGAASQANDYYLSQLNDKVPQLEQNAYGKYRDDVNDQYNQLGAVQGEEQRQYQQYLDDLGQWNNDRSYYTGMMQEAQGQQNFYDNMDYNKYLTDLGQWNTDTDRTTNNDRYKDQMEQQGWENRFSWKQFEEQNNQREKENAYNFMDYEKLKELGYDTGKLDDQYAMARNELLNDIKGSKSTSSGGSSRNSSGGSSGGSSSAKPRISVTEVNKSIEEGRLTEGVLSAYEYYYGEPYFEEQNTESEFEPFATGHSVRDENFVKGYGFLSNGKIASLMDEGVLETYEDDDGKLKYKVKR